LINLKWHQKPITLAIKLYAWSDRIIRCYSKAEKLDCNISTYKEDLKLCTAENSLEGWYFDFVPFNYCYLNERTCKCLAEMFDDSKEIRK